MSNLVLSEQALNAELERITSFIKAEVREFKVVMGLSGGLDSDVAARLCQRAVGSERLKCVTVLQEHFEPKYIHNAHNLADDLGVRLIEIPFGPFPQKLISILSECDPEIGFKSEPIALDVVRGKNAIRTFIYAIYAEHGYLVVGTTNKTELELGYFLPLGDHVAHICPIIHLYKTQVRQLAEILGTRPEVISQAPAAGLRIGDEDLIGIASWLYNGAPIQVEKTLDPASIDAIRKIYKELSFFALDQALIGINLGWEPIQIADASKLSVHIVEMLIRLTKEVHSYKRRDFGVSLAKD
jgi:NAD+ synthase